MNFFCLSAATLFEAITNVRNILFDKNVFSTYTSSLPVVSIGNVTVGGTGKTPLTIFLVQQLQRQGRKPVVLSRGYGGSAKGPIIVDMDDPRAVSYFGDEPVLIARQTGVPVVVAKKRVTGAQLIETEKLGDIILLDDGFQHRWLNRTMNIICIDVSSEKSIEAFRKRRLLPFGIFRESLRKSLNRIDYVCFSFRRLLHEKDMPIDLTQLAERVGIPETLPSFSTYFSDMNVRIGQKNTVPMQRITPLISIANPEGILQSLCDLGYQLTDPLLFPDHHEFSSGDFDRIREALRVHPVVCTPKDYVRLPADLQKFVGVVEAEFRVFPGDFTERLSFSS